MFLVLWALTVIGIIVTIVNFFIYCINRRRLFSRISLTALIIACVCFAGATIQLWTF